MRGCPEGLNGAVNGGPNGGLNGALNGGPHVLNGGVSAFMYPQYDGRGLEGRLVDGRLLVEGRLASPCPDVLTLNSGLTLHDLQGLHIYSPEPRTAPPSRGPSAPPSRGPSEHLYQSIPSGESDRWASVGDLGVI